MRRDRIDLDRLYDGSDIMNFYLDGLFIKGDEIVAIDENYVERFRLNEIVEGKFDFESVDSMDILEFYDLACCKFVINLKK